MKRSIITVSDLSLRDLKVIFDKVRKIKSSDSLSFLEEGNSCDKKKVVMLFLEPSTRTRFSFELASKACGFVSVNFDPNSGTSLTKGEGLNNTIKTLNAMDFDCVIVRSKNSGEVSMIRDCVGSDVSVINAGDGANEHPTQALLDLFTILEAFSVEFSENCLKGAKIGICGDVLHSRVTRSNVKLLTSLGASLTLVTSPSLMPFGLEEYYKREGCEISYCLNSCISTFDMIMMLRLQKERYRGTGNYGYILSSQYSLNDNLIRDLRADAFIMHPSPVNHMCEITNEIAYNDSRSLILKQVENAVPIRIALLKHLLYTGLMN